MNRLLRVPCLLLAGMILLAGCAATTTSPLVLFDLGPLRPAAAMPAVLPALGIATATSSPFLDSPQMSYRLAYANDQQPHQYAESRWTMAPAQLLEQRLKARLGQAGNQVVAGSDGAINVPLVRLDADEFVQVFSSPTQSEARVSVRVAVFNGRLLLAQKTFAQQGPAPSADAAGGARALADASDALITELVGWLGTLPLKK